MALTHQEIDELESLLRRAHAGPLAASDESALRRLLDAHNPGAAGLPLDMLIDSGMIQLGAAILLERLTAEA